jgi:tetraacyldisaccharide 4'-kinase
MSQGNGHTHWRASWLRSAQRRGALARSLWPVSLAYRALIALRRALYGWQILPSHRPEVPVLVVGNVVLGGAGKTPTTLALVKHLQSRGWRPGVISRGHGRSGDGVVHVEPDGKARLTGDEPLLIRQRTGVPVCVARSRSKAAQALLAAYPHVDLLVCDDGMQHLALRRDLTVAVFDDRGVGNGWLLPAGLLREPWPLAPGVLGRPDVVLRQGTAGAAAAPLPAPDGVPVFQAVRHLSATVTGPGGKSRQLEDLRGQPLIAVAGIARPEVFFDMLRQRGLTLSRCMSLPDHAPAADYAVALSTAQHALICTEKDAVKLFPLVAAEQGRDVWAVPLELSPQPEFFAFVDAQLARLSSGHGHQTA